MSVRVEVTPRVLADGLIHVLEDRGIEVGAAACDIAIVDRGSRSDSRIVIEIDDTNEIMVRAAGQTKAVTIQGVEDLVSVVEQLAGGLFEG